ncbi:MAG: hypothetical protein Fur0032_18990 [Terrimicrobiaceae bacterium]
MMRWILLFLIAATGGAWATVDTSPLEKLPVQEGGRKKPYLVFAEESLLGISGRRAMVLDGRKVGAMEFVTGMWLAPEGWEKLPVVLVNHQPLKARTGLEAGRKWFSYEELVANTELRKLLAEAAALRARPGNNRLTGLPKEAADVGLRLGVIEELADGGAFRVVAHPTLSDGPWSPVEPSRLDALRKAWQAGDDAAFQTAAAALVASLAAEQPPFQPPGWRIDLETLYQKSHPIRWAWVCYLAAGVVMLAGYRSPGAYIGGWVLALAGFALQVAGFSARIAISGRPPVTNMYESIIWVAFGTVALALIFEAIYRTRVILLSAIPVAVVSLILADSLPQSLSRSINPLVPVLRDNFWLTTHVLTITLSYAAFALALGLGHVALGTIIAGRKPRAELYNYLYRSLQVGVLLLTVGTILGAVWANYSWGRFWDWDPKEVWALVTLLAYLFVLHGRIAGKWAGFGMAVGSVVCFLCVLMAWYGVNFVLGVGLHSYGFGSGGFGFAVAFVAAELVFLTVAIWRKISLDCAVRNQSPTTTGVPSLTRS